MLKFSFKDTHLYFQQIKQFFSDKIASLVGKKIFSLVGVVLLVAGLPVVLLASRQQTETKQHAAANMVQMATLAGSTRGQITSMISGKTLSQLNTSQKQSLHEAIALHHQTMESLMKTDPQAVLDNAIPADIKSKLPEIDQSLVENTFATGGEYDMYHADYFDKKTSSQEYFLKSVDGNYYTLHFTNSPQTINTGSQIILKNGVVLGNNVAINPANIITTRAAIPTPTPSVQTFKTAVVLFNFQNDRSEPQTPETVKKWIFGPFTDSSSGQGMSINDFLNESSYGKVKLIGDRDPTGDVFGWVPIADDKASCDNFETWKNHAIQGVKEKYGIDISQANYNRVIYAFPHIFSQEFSCWGGIGTGYTIAVNELFSSQDAYLHWFFPALAHELGHSLTNMQHAAGYSCHLIDNCSKVDSGDPFDVMNLYPYENISFQYNSFHKIISKWITKENITDVKKPGNTYVLYPVEMNKSTDGRFFVPNTIRIPLSSDTYYYLEYRQPIGFFDSHSNANGFRVVKGVLIRKARGDFFPGINEDSFLYDITTGSMGENDTSKDFYDSALLPGKTFYDSINNIRIEIVNPLPNAVTDPINVKITFGDQDNPTIKTTPFPLTPTIAAPQQAQGCGIGGSAGKGGTCQVACDASSTQVPVSENNCGKYHQGAADHGSYQQYMCCIPNAKTTTTQNIPVQQSASNQQFSGGINATLVSGITPVGSCVGIIERGTTAADYNNQNASSFNAHPNPNIPSEKTLIDTNSWPHWPILYASGGCVKTWCTNGNLYADFTWPTGYTDGNAEKNYSLNLWMSSTRHGSLAVGKTQNTTLQFASSDAGALVDASISNAYGETGWPITYFHLATCSTNGAGGGGGGVKLQ